MKTITSIKIDRAFLNMAEPLMAYLRTHSDSGELKEAIICFGESLKRFIQGDKEGIAFFISKFSEIISRNGRQVEMLKSLKDRFVDNVPLHYPLDWRPGSWWKALKYRFGTYPREVKGTAAVRVNDLRFLSQSCLLVKEVGSQDDPRMLSDYCDAVHGVSRAIQNQDLDRSGYASVYFAPFLAKWKGRTPTLSKVFEEWEQAVDEA